MKALANIFSYLFHPVFVIIYMLMILAVINPYAFALEGKQFGIIAINVFFLTVFFPLIAVVLLKFLGLIESFKMETQKERIGPMIVTGLFSMWLFINIKGNNAIDPMFSNFVLGSTISIFLGMMCNSFFKISLHAIAMGGLVMGIILARFANGYADFMIDFLEHNAIVHFNLVLLISIFIAGIVGTSRLVLKAHTPREVYVGYLVGAIAQLIAYRFFM